MSTSRRDFLVAAGAGLAALALPGRSRALSRFASATAPSGFASFVSEPSLKPPTIAVTTLGSPAPGYVFASALNGPGQCGPIMFDDHGNVVWFRKINGFAANFRTQVYAGKPVLTWWEGTVNPAGYGVGEGVIADSTYKTVARVTGGNGLQPDVHELLLTPEGTALVTVYNLTQTDLTPVGGAARGNVLDSIVQEIDVKTGRVLLEWHSLDHVPLTDTYSAVLDPFDYFHVNSIDVDPLDGNLLVSARNTSAVYKLDRRSGAVLWTLGGRRSDFELGPGATFMLQHDARGHTDGTLTLYDDGPVPASSALPDSRAIRLGLDIAGKRADLLQAYHHPQPLKSAAMGNAQSLPGDAVFVGWGTEPYLTEFGPGGDVRFDATFVGGGWNYRGFRSPWTGRPAARPAVAAVGAGKQVKVYASWNGSTETAFWRISAGESRGSLAPVKVVPRVGFETVATVAGRSAFFSVTALDSGRRELATSRTVAVRR